MERKLPMAFLLVVLVFVLALEVAEVYSSCSSDDFSCLSGECIPHVSICNGVDDCRDSSDERFCYMRPYNSCPNGWIKCDTVTYEYTRCIPGEWKCNRRRDCRDNSDEKECNSCSPNPCRNNGTCINSSRRAECLCIGPFFGDRCEKNMCSPNPCENEGTCTVQNSIVSCSCKGSSTGNRCEFANGMHAITGAIAAHASLTQHFLNLRESKNSINKWGPHLHRIAMALYLSDPNFFAAGNRTGEEIAYEVSLQLLSKLALKKKIPTWQLSQFINSLLVSCINPRDFFGVDVVAELRKRVDNSNYTNPFSILTLCNAKDAITLDDVKKVVSAFDAHHNRAWTDTQALSTIALACISSRTNLNILVDDRLLTKMAIELKRKQHKNGTIESLKTTGLVLQALLASDNYRENFDLEESVKYIVHQINSRSVSTIDGYFILPVLSFKSLANISSDHCSIPLRTDLHIPIPLELRHKQDDRIQVQYSVYIGDEMEFIRTWKINVAANYSLYQVMENIGEMEPEYKAQYSIFEGKPYVNGLSKLVDDAENEMFWFTYTQTLNTTEQQKRIKDSPVDIKVKPNEEFILWYRTGSWSDASRTGF